MPYLACVICNNEALLIGEATFGPPYVSTTPAGTHLSVVLCLAMCHQVICYIIMHCIVMA